MTTYTTPAAAQGLGRKTLYMDFRSETIATPVLLLNDVLEVVPVFAGETVVSVELMCSDLDTNGTPLVTLDVGDGDDPDRYILASTVGQTSIFTVAKHTAGAPYVYATDDTIDVLVKAAPATSVVGTVTVSILVI